MPTGSQLALFTVASLALIFTPGPDILYVLTRGMAEGRRAALAAAVACLAVFWAMFHERAFLVGTRDEFLADKAVLIVKSHSLFPVLAVAMCLAGAVLIWSSLRISGRLDLFRKQGIR